MACGVWARMVLRPSASCPGCAVPVSPPPRAPRAVSPHAQLTRFLRANPWLKALVGSFEDLPVCISIASASAEMRGFPLVYVNKCFEMITGYNRSEIIGQNCKFLQVRASRHSLLVELYGFAPAALTCFAPCAGALCRRATATLLSVPSQPVSKCYRKG